MKARSYEVIVRFCVDGDQYGKERYDVAARSAEEAKAEAIKMSDDSVYADSRIDYTREALVASW